MKITATALRALETGFRADFNTGREGIKPNWNKIATRVPSSSKLETYGWLGAFPKMREWIGDRFIHTLDQKAYKLQNKKFEVTIGVERDDISDDNIGMYGPLFREMGQQAEEHTDELVFETLAEGFQTECYDGQNYFDTEHPVGLDEDVELVSNFYDGAGPAWYLMDVSRPLKPLIYQDREAVEFQMQDDPDNPHVFKRDEFLYGARKRGVSGFGFWQMAFASKEPLTAANYEKVRTAMRSQRDDRGNKLVVRPKLLVVPPQLEGAALRLLNNEYGAGGATNEWKGTAELHVEERLG
jgi:phage major head subunit gpT-like protein